MTTKEKSNYLLLPHDLTPEKQRTMDGWKSNYSSQFLFISLFTGYKMKFMMEKKTSSLILTGPVKWENLSVDLSLGQFKMDLISCETRTGGAFFIMGFSLPPAK